MPAFSLRNNSPERRIARIELSRIAPASHQARRSFDAQQLESLADSIRSFGLLTPLLVRRKGEGFELIAGERRLRALKLLGYSHAEAIITSGGIKVSEIDPKTMESKLISGLYFAGEIIDCDAYTGGFNLQIAWSTAYAAAMAASVR